MGNKKRLRELEVSLADALEKIRALEAENARLKEENKQLRKDLRSYKNENSPSSSVPPWLKESLQKATEPKPVDEEKLPPAPNMRNKRQKPKKTVVHRLPKKCPDCGNLLSIKKQRRKRDVNHIIPAMVEPRRHESERGYCPHCKKEVVAKIPDALPNCKYDLTFAIICSFLSVGCNMSLGAISRFFREMVGIRVPKATVSNALVRLKEYLGQEYKSLEDEIRKSACRNRDESPWFLNGKMVWNFVVATKKAVLYRIERNRRQRHVLRIKGKGGTDTHDGYAGYNQLTNDHQRCWSHVSSIAKAPEHPFRSAQQARRYERFVRRLMGIFHLAKEERKKLGCSVELRKRYDKLLLRYLQSIRNPEPNSLKLINYLMGGDGDWFAFLEHPEVEPTNNRAERALRHIVLKRKISQQSRGKEAMRSYEMQASLYMTSHQNGQKYTEYLGNVVNGQLHAVGKF